MTVTNEDVREDVRPRARLSGWVDAQRRALPRFVVDAQPSVEQRLRKARHGDHSVDDGRGWRVVWVWVVSAPAGIVFGFLAWAADSPGRFFPVLVVFLIVSTVLHGWPVTSWLIPDWLSLSTWPPFVWLT